MLGTVVGSDVCKVRQTTLFCVCVHVLLAPPSGLGALSIALVLSLLFKYYYTKVMYIQYLLSYDINCGWPVIWCV